jgi:hypothetical protein
MLDRVSMVRARPLEQLLKVIWGTLGRRLFGLALGSDHEGIPTSLLALPFLRAIGGAFAGILVPLCLASGAVKNRSDRLVT